MKIPCDPFPTKTLGRSKCLGQRRESLQCDSDVAIWTVENQPRLQTATLKNRESQVPLVLWGHFLLDKGESTREKTFGWVFATKRPLIFFWCKILNPFLHTEISLRFCGPVCPKYTKPFSNPTPSGDGSRFHWLPDTQRSARIQQKVGLCFTPSILFWLKSYGSYWVTQIIHPFEENATKIIGTFSDHPKTPFCETRPLVYRLEAMLNA